MLILLVMLLLPIPVGLMYTCLLGKNDRIRFLDNYMLGIFTMMLAVQAICCVCVKLNNSFDLLEKASIVCVLCLAVAGILLGRKGILSYVSYLHGIGRPGERHTETVTITLTSIPTSKKRTVFLWIGITAIFLIQYLSSVIFIPYTGSEVTLETIYVTRLSRQLFQFNPVTGARLVNGVYPVFKLVTLPIFYALICDISKVPETLLLFRIVPFVVQFIHYLLIYRIASVLAGHKKERRARFLFIYMLLLFVGDALEDSFSFGLMHEAWKGKTIMQGLMVLVLGLMVYRVCTNNGRVFGAVGALISFVVQFSVLPVNVLSTIDLNAVWQNREWKILILAVMTVYILRARNNLKWKTSEKVIIWLIVPLSVIYAGATTILALSFAAEHILAIAESKNRGGLAFAGIIILVFLTGNIIPHRCPATLHSTVDDDSKAVVNWVSDYADEMNGILLAAPEDIMEYSRMANPKVLLPYGKDLWHVNCNFQVGDAYDRDVAQLYDHMRVSELQPDSAAAMAGSMGVKVLIMKAEATEEITDLYRYNLAEKIGAYSIYVR